MPVNIPRALLTPVKRPIVFVLSRIDRLAALMSWRGLRRFICDHLGSLDGSALVLNVGAGGRTARVIAPLQARQGFRVVSLDIDPAREPDIVGDVITYESQAQFDAILMIEVLEHVRAPREAIANVHRLLKPGGVLLLSTPFLFPLHDRPMDYFRYTRYGLELLFEPFERVEITARDRWAENLCVLVARMIREPSLSARLFAPVAVLLAAIAYPAAMLLGKLVRTDAYTSGHTVIARKAAR